MNFEWDTAKNRINIRKHGIDFNDAVDIFKHPILNLIDGKAEYGEERWIAIGLIKAIVGVVIYTEREGSVVRIISARKATRNEVRLYEKSIYRN
ncbi:Conserved hypothetical protein DUF497 [Candidatus Glomeribacter gigasporarum BEG34]|uniref:BrnT family toxin n=1 Tax=Candidatus Glomeribacter gigasporarum BEG34 TaxID=1070319 RepID=G2JBU3_9BURK|nr:BrnT family toxin [Candidatus Glomeribacter gigasporarum]CCD30248.1 Conserved hypothetical protein DUF497 [Candidatus Glomeribacter gigasporarum BEG34]